jgi:hypothetical protein
MQLGFVSEQQHSPGRVDTEHMLSSTWVEETMQSYVEWCVNKEG